MLNFYRRFLPHAASLQAHIHDVLSGPKLKDSHPITWTNALHTAFNECKVCLSRPALLAHPDQFAPLTLVTDDSTNVMVVVLQQRVQDAWQPLAFSRKLSPAQQKHSAYDMELLAMYKAVRYVCHKLEARHFTFLMENKPLTFAINQTRDKCSPRQFNLLDFISQFITDILHICGQDIVADALCRVEVITAPVTHDALAPAQIDDDELLTLLVSSTTIQLKNPHPRHRSPATPVANHDLRHITPRRQVFKSLHSLIHPGIKATAKLFSQRFVWPAIQRLRTWAQTCQPRQRSKVSRHTTTPVGNLVVPAPAFYIFTST